MMSSKSPAANNYPVTRSRRNSVWSRIYRAIGWARSTAALCANRKEKFRPEHADGSIAAERKAQPAVYEERPANAAKEMTDADIATHFPARRGAHRSGFDDSAALLGACRG